MLRGGNREKGYLVFGLGVVGVADRSTRYVPSASSNGAFQLQGRAVGEVGLTLHRADFLLRVG